MKDFFQFREQQLNEMKGGGVRDSLNRLQIWWENHSGEYGFLDPKNPKQASLYPIMQPPFDIVRKGGIVVMGYNPGTTGGLGQKFRDAVDEIRARDEAGRLPLVYHPEKKGWFYIHSSSLAGEDDQIGFRQKRHTTRGGDFKRSAFNNENWLQSTNQGKKFHKKGAFLYHRAFNKMLDDVGLGDQRSKVMAINWVPFASSGDEIPHRREVEKESTKWVKAFLKTAQPKLIMTTTTVFDLAMREMGGRKFTNKVKRPPSVAGNVDNRRFYESGILSDGTPIIAFAHWSSAKTGGPSNRAWNEDNIELMKADIKSLMKTR